MLLMAKKSGKAKPITVRIDAELFERINAIAERAPFKPTMTQLVEKALAEFAERAELDAARRKRQ